MALTKIDDRGLKTPIDLLDNEKIRLGTGNDLELYHDGSNSYINNSTGALYLRTGTGFNVQNAGGTETYLYTTENGGVFLKYDNSTKLETTSSGATVTGALAASSGFSSSGGTVITGVDNGTIYLGTGLDFRLYHDGSNSYLTNDTGVLNIQGGGGNIQLQAVDGESGLIVKPDDSVELYFNGSKKFETTSNGATCTGWLQGTQVYATDYIKVSDSDKFLAGNSDDLQIYHDPSTNNIIDNVGSLTIQKTDGDKYIHCSSNAQVELYHDGSKKFRTTTSGIEVVSTSNTPLIDYVGASNNTLGRIDSDAISSTTSNMRFYVETGGSIAEKLRIQTGGGISFNGDTAAANALDDYEEGSWTPTTSQGVDSISNASCRYVKIGNVCTVSVNFTPSGNASSDSVIFSGLPYTSHSSHSGSASVMHNGFDEDSSPEPTVHAYVGGSSTNFYIYYSRTNGAGWQNATGGQVHSHQMIFNLTYPTA